MLSALLVQVRKPDTAETTDTRSNWESTHTGPAPVAPAKNYTARKRRKDCMLGYTAAAMDTDTWVAEHIDTQHSRLTSDNNATAAHLHTAARHP